MGIDETGKNRNVAEFDVPSGAGRAAMTERDNPAAVHGHPAVADRRTAYRKNPGRVIPNQRSGGEAEGTRRNCFAARLRAS